MTPQDQLAEWLDSPEAAEIRADVARLQASAEHLFECVRTAWLSADYVQGTMGLEGRGVSEADRGEMARRTFHTLAGRQPASC